jgi:hypothetical protein
MKKLHIVAALAICLISLSYFQVNAQNDPQPIITVTRSHWNMDYENFSMDEWKKLEAEYHEKVIMKNEYIIGAVVLLHNYTPDNSEILFGQVYSNWDNVDKAAKRNAELEKEAWPDEAARNAFFDKQSAYYSDMHSDEIYSSMTLGKAFTAKPTEPLIYYVRTTHRAWPKDGKMEDIQAMRQEYIENVIFKNNDIQAYFPMRHLYGADSRERTEVFAMKSMADLEKMNLSGSSDLVKAHWPDETKRKAFFDAYNKYRAPWHGDLIYTSVPELGK